jgi:hypothetical protein
MTFIENYGKELVALVVPFITWGLNKLFKAKAKLHISNPHNFTFVVPEPLRDAQGNVIHPNQTVQTRSIMLANAGTETATNIELVFNSKPQFINFWPARQYSDRVLPDGRYSVIFPSLSPNEVMGCETFSINIVLPMLGTARCDQCVARHIDMYPQPITALWKSRLFWFFAFAGLGVTVYFGLTLIQYIVLKTPLFRA